MKYEEKRVPYAVCFLRQNEEMQIDMVAHSKDYRSAFLDNDSGMPNEYCMNTASWD